MAISKIVKTFDRNGAIKTRIATLTWAITNVKYCFVEMVITVILNK